MTADEEVQIREGLAAIKQIVDTPGMESIREILGHGADKVATDLTRLRKAAEGLGMPTTEIDERLELIRGTSKRIGLLKCLGVDHDAKKEKPEEPDPLQADIEDKPDYATHDKTTAQVEEYIAKELVGSQPAAAIRMLNALEDGENQRPGGARESVLKAIRNARAPLSRQVTNLSVN